MQWGSLEDDDFFPVIETLRGRLAEIDRELKVVEKPVAEIETGTDVIPWEHVLDHIDSIPAKREYLSRYIERIDVGKHSIRGSRTFDTSTVKITWRDTP